MKFLNTILKLLLIVPALTINTDNEQPEKQQAEEPKLQVFDISKEERKDLAYTERKVLDSLDYEQITSKYSIPINKVVDDEKPIWDNPDHPFRSMGIIYSDGQPVLVSVEESGPGIKHYYEKQQEEWVEVPQETYLALVKHLVDQVPIISHFALNLSFLLENEKYRIDTYPKKHADLVIYSPTMNHRVRAVHVDDNVMWTSSTPTERCATVIAYNKGTVPLLADLIIVSDHEPMKHLYLMPEDDDWVQVEEAVYMQKILTLKYDNEDVLPVTLDLDQPDKILFNVTVRTFERPYYTYAPKGFMRITKVVDGDHVVWESDNPTQFFAYSAGFTDDQGLPMVFLNLNQAVPSYNLVFGLRPTGWEPTSLMDLDDRIGEVQQARYTIMDLQDVDEDKINVLPLVMISINYILFTSKSSYDIMIVKDGDQVIWNYGGLEAYLTNGWLYYLNEEPKLLHFRVREPILGHEDYYFRKQDGYWTRMPKFEYVTYLNELTYSIKPSSVHTDDHSTSAGTMKLEDLDSSEPPKAPSPVKEPTEPEPSKEKTYAEYEKSDYKSESDVLSSKIVHYVPDKDPSAGDRITVRRRTRLYEFEERKEEEKEETKPTPKKGKTVTFDHIEPRDVEKYLDEAPSPHAYHEHKSIDDIRRSRHDDLYPRHRRPLRKIKSASDVSHKKITYDSDSESEDSDTAPLVKPEAKPKLKKRHSKKPKKDSAFIPTLGLFLALAIFTVVF